MQAASPARRCALRVLRRVFDEGAWADRAFRGEAEDAGLAPQERAFAQQLAYGTVQRVLTLDHVLARLSSRPLRQIDPPVRDALRLGLFQLLYLDRVPDHAAVAQTVELAARRQERARGFVNALMRRATREGHELLERLDDSDPSAAALAHSHPEWLVRMWWDALGPEETLALLKRDNQPAESSVRANTLVTSREELEAELRELGAEPRADELAPEALVLEAPFDAHGSAPFRAGRLMPQSRASMLVARLLDPQPGERVLDLCAAPGGKTTHLAAISREPASLVAVEAHEGRARELAENCERMRAAAEVHCGDAREPAPGGPFERILLDAPCSDLGTLQSRPDARWRKRADQIDDLAGLQRELLESAAAQLAPGGTLVFSTCTISPRENEELIAGFLDDHPDLRADELGSRHPGLAHARDPRFLRTLPHRDLTDGFFIARVARPTGQD